MRRGGKGIEEEKQTVQFTCCFSRSPFLTQPTMGSSLEVSTLKPRDLKGIDVGALWHTRPPGFRRS